MNQSLGTKSPKYLSRPAAIVVRPAPGWLDTTADELQSLLDNPLGRYKFQPEMKKDKGALMIRNTDFRQAIELCMRAKTVHDIEWLAWEGRCKSWGDLGRACEAINALGFINRTVNQSLNHSVNHSGVNITVRANASFVLSSAIIKSRFLAAAELTENADSHLNISLDLYRDRLKILISLPGEALYKRGYKKNLGGASAPLPEHQGAACIYHAWREIVANTGPGSGCGSGLSGGTSSARPNDLSLVSGVYVPFAGTGTLAFEWVLLANQTSVVRDFFAFEGFRLIPERTIANLRHKIATQATQQKQRTPVLCLERESDVLGLLQDNVSHFSKLTGTSDIEVLEGDFFKSNAEQKLHEVFSAGSNVLVFLNPPYGKRLKNSSESKLFFRRIAEHLIDLEVRTGLKFSGFCLIPEESAALAWVRAMRHTHHTKTSHFSHGGIDMRLVSFCSHDF